MPRTRLRIAGLVAAALWLGACAGDPARNPAWQLAGHPGLLYQIRFYYERNAREEGGRCTAPLLEGVTRSEVLAEDQDQLVIQLDYRYRDTIRDEPRLPSGQLSFLRECTGFAIAHLHRREAPRGPRGDRHGRAAAATLGAGRPTATVTTTVPRTHAPPACPYWDARGLFASSTTGG